SGPAKEEGGPRCRGSAGRDDIQPTVAGYVTIDSLAPVARRHGTIGANEEAKEASRRRQRKAGHTPMSQKSKYGSGHQRETGHEKRNGSLRPRAQSDELLAIPMFLHHGGHTDAPEQPTGNRQVPVVKISPGTDCRPLLLKISRKLR